MRRSFPLALILLMLSAFATPARAAESEATRQYDAAMMRMHKGMPDTFTGDVDTDFAAGMVPHHQAAVDMAKTELAYGKDPAIRFLATSIILSQQVEIGIMQQWLNTRGYLFTDPDSPATPKFREANAVMHHAMHSVAYTGDPDVDFVVGMIPHHQGAVDMAKVQLEYGRTKLLNDMALGIAQSQSQEIGLMNRWLEKHTAKKE